MKYPNFQEEKKLWKRGIKYVVGLDEAGRGPLAGPVVAAAVLVNANIKNQNGKSQFKIQNLRIDDSKKLSEKQREYFYGILTNHPQIEWGVGIVSEKIIDKINILQATKLAMQKAYSNVLENYGVSFLLIDGNFCLDTSIPQKSIIKGDAKVFSIAAASIIAKVTRDRIMQTMHKKYPQYNFAKHKGYGTAVHLAVLKKFGPCKIHRLTFAKVLPNSASSDKINAI